MNDGKLVAMYEEFQHRNAAARVWETYVQAEGTREERIFRATMLAESLGGILDFDFTKDGGDKSYTFDDGSCVSFGDEYGDGNFF